MNTTSTSTQELALNTHISTISCTDLTDIEKELSSSEHDRTIILDFQQITQKQTVLWFRQLRTLYRQYRYIILGLIHTNINLEHAKAANMNILDDINLSASSAPSQPPAQAPINIQTQPTDENTLLVQQNIRSGQRVHHTGDLVIIGNVNPGSEVIAGGHLHIYGQLAGRALAGTNNQPSAIIYCQSLAAELVAIDGHYHSSDEMSNSLRPTLIYLKNEQLNYQKT